jgi:hypothetical protein
MGKIDRIIIHHSASDFGDAKQIDRWHKERGWKSIGYHFVFLNGFRNGKDLEVNRINQIEIGTIEKGRRLDADPWLEADEIGAHCYGFNSDSIGICLIHNRKDYPIKQLMSYRDFCAGLCVHFNINPMNIKGHYELDDKKPECPSLEMDKERLTIQQRMVWAKQFYMPFLYKYLDK